MTEAVKETREKVLKFLRQSTHYTKPQPYCVMAAKKGKSSFGIETDNWEAFEEMFSNAFADPEVTEITVESVQQSALYFAAVRAKDHTWSVTMDEDEKPAKTSDKSLE